MVFVWVVDGMVDVCSQAAARQLRKRLLAH